MQKGTSSVNAHSNVNCIDEKVHILSKLDQKNNRSLSPEKVLDKAPKAPKEKKDIDNINTWEPTDFSYYKTLGEGAFGIVRKCELTFEAANSSTSDGSDDENNKKFFDKDSRMMAVKLQSKYQLIKNK